jgi:peptidoglycan/LPS O-acetylase OafA/YrhL
MKKLVDVFDPRMNALNAVRLLLCIGVIVYHSFPLTGTRIRFAPVDQLLGSVFVDAFFAISGYLILSSWVRRPHWWAFLRARVLRIMPAFYVSALITAFVIAPAAVLIAGNGFPADFGAGAVAYIVGNALLRVHNYAIAGTPLGVPYPHVWNGSIWTLWWEFLCYLGVLALGLVRALRWRATVVLAFVLAALGLAATAYGPVHNYYLDNGSRFGLMFLAGSVIFTFRDKLPVSWALVGVAGLVVLASSVLPDYRIVAALPLAYVAIGAGALTKHPRLRLANDVSYGTYIYAFPMQQLLATAGLYRAGVPVFAIASIVVTIPLAVASWFGVEKQALKLKGSASRKPKPAAEPTDSDDRRPGAIPAEAPTGEAPADELPADEIPAR